MAGNYRVLLVEEELHDADLVQRMLGQCPSDQFQVEYCGRLDEAIQRLTAATFDVVLLDLTLPDSRGMVTFEAVQQAAPAVPIVVLSGFEDEGLALNAVKRGAQDYLVKRLDSDDTMIRAVRYAIERHRAGQVLREREEHLRLLSEQLPCMFWTTDTHLHVTRVYGMAAAVGRDVDCQRTLSLTDLFPVESPEQLFAAHEDAMHGASRVVEIDSLDRIFQVVLQPFRQRSGQITGTIGMALDITQQRHLDVELRVTRKVHDGLRPQAAPSVPHFDLAGDSVPASAAGGDYFDYFPIRDGATGVVVCDVGGHGLGPAMVMCQTRGFLRALSVDHDDPGEMLSLTNAFLANATNEQRLVALFFAKLNPAERSLTYANAGQRAYLLDRQGDARLLEPTSIPLNVREDETIPTSDPIAMSPGELAILYTDGITEATAREGTQFGTERMLRLIHEQRARSAKEIVELLFTTVRDFSLAGQQEDDMTAVLIKAT